MRWLHWGHQKRQPVLPSSPMRSTSLWEPSRIGKDSDAIEIIGGRRHLANVPYLLPKDLRERERLDFQHYLLRQVLRGNYAAPLRPPMTSVLDVGCGTGRWCQEMAQAFPHTSVVGLDLEEIKERNGTAFPSYTFVQGNLLNGLPFADRSFDLTHQRLLVAGIPTAKWSFVLRELVRVTRIGGWVELLEAGNTFLNAGSKTRRFLTWWIAISQSRGINAGLVEDLGSGLQHAGLHNIRTQTLELPLGPWGRREGILLQQDMLAGFPSLKEHCYTLLQISAMEFDQVLAALPHEWEVNQTRYCFYLAYGQRQI